MKWFRLCTKLINKSTCCRIVYITKTFHSSIHHNSSHVDDSSITSHFKWRCPAISIANSMSSHRIQMSPDYSVYVGWILFTEGSISRSTSCWKWRSRGAEVPVHFGSRDEEWWRKTSFISSGMERARQINAESRQGMMEGKMELLLSPSSTRVRDFAENSNAGLILTLWLAVPDFFSVIRYNTSRKNTSFLNSCV